MHYLALENVVGKENLKHPSPAIGCVNINAVTWIHKFRSNKSAGAATILPAPATRIHDCRADLLAWNQISGMFNTMAEVASRKHTTNIPKFLQDQPSKPQHEWENTLTTAPPNNDEPNSSGGTT